MLRKIFNLSNIIIHNMLQKIPDSLAPCGVYCEVCPSFKKNWNGCGSENKNQKGKANGVAK
jgi:hypothetical protein